MGYCCRRGTQTEATRSREVALSRPKAFRVRVMVQEAGIPESQAMLISGHETRSMLERYNIVSLKNVQDAGAKLHAWSKSRKPSKATKGKVVAIGSKRRKAS